MKTKSASSEKKSAAATDLGGQPESDKDAQEAGFASATAMQKPKKKSKRTKSESIRTDPA